MICARFLFTKRFEGEKL